MSAVLRSCSRFSHNSNPFFIDIHQRSAVSVSSSFDASATTTSRSVGGGGGGGAGGVGSGGDRQFSGAAQDGVGGSGATTCASGAAMDHCLNAAADAPACTKCRQAIRDRYLVRIRGRVWHEQCALCTVCGVKLPEFCFVIENQLLCRQDYHRLYATKCATCKQPMLSHELCMRTRDPSAGDNADAAGLVHHVSCFVCSICSLPLAAGEPYTYHPTTGALVCKADFLRGLTSSRPGAGPPSSSAEAAAGGSGGGGGGPAASSSTVDVSVARKRHFVGDSGPLSSSSSSGAAAVAAAAASTQFSAGDPNAKRGRTTLSYEQRCRLQEVFDADCRPPRKVREALARDMDLPVRVIQVWFQNQRAREKKLACSSAGGGGGEPMVDSLPPVTTPSDYHSRLVIRRQTNSAGWQHGSSDGGGGGVVESADINNTLPSQSPSQFPPPPPQAWRPEARSVSSPSAPGSLQSDPPNNPAHSRLASAAHSPAFAHHQQGSWLPNSPVRLPNRQV